MRPTVLILIAVAGSLLLTIPPHASGQSAPAVSPCQAESDRVTVSAAVQQQIPYLFEVDLTFRNRSSASIHVDPAAVVLVPDRGGAARPLTLDQAWQAIRSPVSVGAYWFVVFGSFGIFISVDSQELLARDVERRILRPAAVSPGASLRGSAYFRPSPDLTQFALLVDGLTAESGEVLPAVLLKGCAVPGRRAPSGPSGAAPELRAATPNVRAAAGPIVATVSSVVMAKDATTVAVALENGAQVEARLFNALADARLTDHTGRSYAVRVLRSDLPDRVPPRASVRGRLVFEPLPLSLAGAATLTLSGVQVGDAAYDLLVEWRF